jgi:hypothetical protein
MLLYLDRQGKLKRSIRLSDEWGPESGLPMSISRDRPDGWIIREYPAKRPGVRIDEDGRIRERFNPVYADGRTAGDWHGIKAAPDGTVWTANRYSLLRLSAKRKVDLVVGEPLNRELLSDPVRIAVGPDDRIYVSDRRTRVVHVFDAEGNLLHMCKPELRETGDDSLIADIAPSADGDVYVQLKRDRWASARKAAPYLHFSRNGKRLAGVILNVDNYKYSRCRFSTDGSGNRWIKGEHDVFRVNSSGKVLRKISRRPDGNWLVGAFAIDVARDGSVAVIALRYMANTLNTYSPAGEPQTTLCIPQDWATAGVYDGWAYDGRHVVLKDRGDNKIYVFTKDGRAVGKARLAVEEKHLRGPYPARNGRELWLIDLKSLKVHRYENPIASGG